MPDASPSGSPGSSNSYCWLFKERNTSFRSTSVYQISRYPSRQNRIEKAFGSQSGGTNTLNAFGKVILHLGLYGAIFAFNNFATMTARLDSSAKVGSTRDADLPPKSNERTGSSCGSFWTCSSDSRRYLPGAISKIQASSSSVPWSHGTQSQSSLGTVIRLSTSAVTCSRIVSGGILIMDILPAFAGFIQG